MWRMARAATTSDVFNAIAEPQRREILVLLRAGERPVTELAQELGMTQPGASKHLRVLREVGLVRDRKAGKQRMYGLDARGLRPVHVDRRVRAVLERELRSAGRVRAGPEAGKTGEVSNGSNRTGRGGAVSDGRPRDRDHTGHQRPAGAGVRGVHRGPAPVAVVEPEGFTTTTRAFEFRVGGEWDFVMHGPDGIDYQEWISWTEIAPPERIELLHGESRGDPNAFESVLTFAPDGAATRIEMRTLFPPGSSATRP